MRTILIATLAVLATGAAGVAHAEESRRLSGPDAAASATICRSLENLGYWVSRVEAEHGRLELRAVNETGLPVKLSYDPATGEMLRAALR